MCYRLTGTSTLLTTSTDPPSLIGPNSAETLNFSPTRNHYFYSPKEKRAKINIPSKRHTNWTKPNKQETYKLDETQPNNRTRQTTEYQSRQMTDFRDKYISSLEEQLEILKKQNLQQEEIISGLKAQLLQHDEDHHKHKRHRTEGDSISLHNHLNGTIYPFRYLITVGNNSNNLSGLVIARNGPSPLPRLGQLSQLNSAGSGTNSPPISAGSNHTLPSLGNRAGGIDFPTPDTLMYRPFSNLSQQFSLPKTSGPACGKLSFNTRSDTCVL